MLVVIVDLWPMGLLPSDGSEVSEASITTLCVRNHIPQSGLVLDGLSLTPISTSIVTYLPLNRNILWHICHLIASWTSASDHGRGVKYHTHVDLHPSSKAEVKRPVRIKISS
jgi:hypothetical protein